MSSNTPCGANDQIMVPGRASIPVRRTVSGRALVRIDAIGHALTYSQDGRRFRYRLTELGVRTSTHNELIDLDEAVTLCGYASASRRRPVIEAIRAWSAAESVAESVDEDAQTTLPEIAAPFDAFCISREAYAATRPRHQRGTVYRTFKGRLYVAGDICGWWMDKGRIRLNEFGADRHSEDIVLGDPSRDNVREGDVVVDAQARVPKPLKVVKLDEHGVVVEYPDGGHWRVPVVRWPTPEECDAWSRGERVPFEPAAPSAAAAPEWSGVERGRDLIAAALDLTADGADPRTVHMLIVYALECIEGRDLPRLRAALEGDQ